MPGEHILTSGEDKRIYMSSIYNAGAPTRSWRSNGVNELVAFHNGMFGLLPYGENKVRPRRQMAALNPTPD